MRFRADQYRRKADRAREFAKQARDPFVKISYQEMARDWAVLAEQAEWFDSQQQPANRRPAIRGPAQSGSDGYPPRRGRPAVA
jgi:hypothetical protein